MFGEQTLDAARCAVAQDDAVATDAQPAVILQWSFEWFDVALALGEITQRRTQLAARHSFAREFWNRGWLASFVGGRRNLPLSRHLLRRGRGLG